MDFTDPGLLDSLEACTDDALDALPFGVVGMALDATVERYNAFESKLAGLSPSRVLGRNFFTEVAPCTNNFMVAHRFETESEFDATIDYVFTLRMKPTPVRLRLLTRPDAAQRFLLVQWN